MKFPSWNEFIEKISNFEKSVDSARSDANFLFGLGFGGSRTFDLFDNYENSVWKEAKTNDQFARGLATGIKDYFEDLDERPKEAIMNFAEKHPVFAQALGESHLP